MQMRGYKVKGKEDYGDSIIEDYQNREIGYILKVQLLVDQKNAEIVCTAFSK